MNSLLSPTVSSHLTPSHEPSGLDLHTLQPRDKITAILHGTRVIMEALQTVHHMTPWLYHVLVSEDLEHCNRTQDDMSAFYAIYDEGTGKLYQNKQETRISLISTINRTL